MIFQVESLGKKYEEKYRQTGDVASKLTIEEATFRDIQVLLAIFNSSSGVRNSLIDLL